MPRTILVLLVALAVVARVQARQPEPQHLPIRPGEQNLPPKAEERWKFQFEPSLWYVAPGGKVVLPGSPAGTARASVDDLNLANPRLTPYGELHLRTGDWTVSLSGFAFSTSDRGAVQPAPGQIGGVVFGAGDFLRSSLDFTSIEAQAAYTLHDRLDGKNFTGTIDVLGGLRFYDVDFHISGPGATTSGEEFFGHPFVGAKLTMDILHDFSIDAQIDLGYFPSGSSGGAMGFEVVAGFQWRPTPNLAVQIGYRDLAYSIRSGSDPDRFEYTGALQGLFAGAVVRF